LNGIVKGTRLAVPALLAAVVGVACNRTAADQTTDAPEYATVERRSLEVTAEAAGAIEPIRVVEVKSKASGEITRLNVETGDRVERGALLVEIDPRDVNTAFEQAQADLLVAEARLETSQTQLTRIEELRKANVATEQELESARLDVANSNAQLVRAQTTLRLAQERQGDVAIRAPITGTVIARPVEVGTIIASASNNVSGGTPLMTMADLSEMQVRALIDETDLGQISPGLEVGVSVEAYPERVFAGRVLKIEPMAIVDQNVTMFPVIVRLDNREGLLRPGMNADVRVEIAQRDNVLAVPNAAVVSPRDAAAAGQILGVPEERMAALRGGPRGRDGATELVSASQEGLQQPAAGSDAGAPAAANGDAATPPAGGQSAECVALRQRVQEAGGPANLSAEDRQKLTACRPAGAGRGQRGGGQRGGDARGRPNDDVRDGVIFVRTATGVEPRRVVLGLNDWDFTEVISGLDEGDQVVLMSVARLQQQQEEFVNRMRERSGGFPGASGGGGGRGR
jgi:HlyD family secretion protein